MKFYHLIVACQSTIIVLLLAAAIILSISEAVLLNKVITKLNKIEQSTESFAKTVEVYQTLNAPAGMTPVLH